MWPAEVFGCAAVVERLVLPSEADEQLPDDPAGRPSSTPPSTRTARRCASSRRPPATASTYCALRLRAHDDALSVLESPDLVPALLELVRSTLEN